MFVQMSMRRTFLSFRAMENPFPPSNLLLLVTREAIADPLRKELVKQVTMLPLSSPKNVLEKKSVPLMSPRKSLEQRTVVVLLRDLLSKLFASSFLEI